MSETFKFGDEVFFTNEIAIQSSDIKIKTYLVADKFGNIMWDIPPKKYNLPIDFDNCLFVLCPKLSYVDKENKLSKESENIIQDVKDTSNEENEDDQDDQDDEEDEAVEKVQYDIADKEAIKKRLLEQEHKEKLKELEERVIIENNRNQEILSNSKGSIVLYGSIVQIMHRSTGKFLCVKHSCAKNDKSCLAMELSDGESLCHFTVTPKYKVRSEGGVVLLDDEIALSPVEQTLSGYYLHGSPPENDDALNVVKVENFDAYESKSGFKYFEANLSRDFIDCGIIVSLHTRSLDTLEDNSKYLRTGDAISFWAPDAEAFIQVTEDEVQNQVSKNASTSSKITVGARLVDVPNKTHPSAFNSSAVWALEKMDRRSGGLIEYKTSKYRIRHVPTNKYLTVSDQEFQSDQDIMKNGEEKKYKLDLLDNEEKDASKISQLFTLLYVDKVSTYVPKEEVLVVLTHSNKNGDHYVHVHQEGKIEKNVDAKRLVLDHHSESTKKKTTSLFSSKKQGFVKNAKVTVLKAGDSEEYRGKIFKDNKDGTFDIFRRISHSDEISESQINRFIYVSNKKRISDALILVAVDAERQEIVEFLRSALAVCESYQKFVKLESAPGKELSQSGKKIDFDIELLVLRKLILGSLGYKDYKGDDLSKIVGRPSELFQNAARAQKILDGCFKMVTAPLLASPFISMEKNGIDDSWQDPRFEVIADVHLKIWQAIRLLVKGNSISEQYVIDLKATIKKLNASERKKEVDTFINLQSDKDRQFLEQKFQFNDKMTTRRLSVNTFNKQKQEEQAGNDSAESEELIPGKVKGTVSGTLSNIMSGKRKSVISTPIQLSSPVQLNQETPKTAGSKQSANEEEDVKGIDVLIIQMPFAVGASQTLTSIIDENMDLLAKITEEKERPMDDQKMVKKGDKLDIDKKGGSSDSIIEKFKTLVRDEGPIKEALSFFSAICACEGKYLRKNQDLLVKQLLKDTTAKASFLFEISSSPPGAITSQILSTKHKFKDVSPILKDKLETELSLSVVLSSEVSGEDASPIFVKWKGSPSWKPGEKSSLFFDAKTIGFRFITDSSNQQWVLLQDLCDPLSNKFAESMKSLSDQLKKAKLGEEKTLKFKRLILERQLQISTYFLESINLMAELCGGRAYQAHAELKEEFTYEVLLNILSDNHLPLAAKGSFVKLMNNLWISQYPHAENCGRQSIPNTIWIESALSQRYIDIFSDSTTEQLGSDAEDILPHFIEFKNDKKQEDSEALFTSEAESEILLPPEPKKYKFHLLVVFVKDFFTRIISKISKFSNFLKSDDVLAIRETVEMSRLLLSYGFIPDLHEIRDLKEILKKLLKSMKNSKAIGKERYNERDEMNFSIMEAKSQILKLLIFEEQLMQEVKLAGFLSIYKERAGRQGSQCISDVINISRRTISDLNHQNEDADFDKHLLDLMMHGDDDLFEQSFQLFQARRTSLRTLLDNSSKVKLLRDKEILKQITIEDLDHLCSDWKRLYENIDLWLVDTMKTFELTLKYSKLMLQLTAEKKLHQEILTLLDLPNLLLLPLKLDSVNHNVTIAFERIRRDSLDVLCMLVEGNKPAAEIISKEVASLTEKLLDPSSSMKKWDLDQQYQFIKLAVTVFKGSKFWTMKTPKAMFKHFVNILLPSEGKISSVKVFQLSLDFYLNQLIDHTVDSFGNEPSPRNQNLVFDSIDTIISKNNSEFNKAVDYDSVLVKVANQAENYQNYLKFIKILSLVSINNPAATNNAMNTIIRWDTLATLIVKFCKSSRSSKMLPSIIKEKKKQEDEFDFLTAHIDLFHNAYCHHETYDEDIIFNLTTMWLMEAILDTFKDEVTNLRNQRKPLKNDNNEESQPLKKAEVSKEIELTSIYSSVSGGDDDDDDDDNIQMMDNKMLLSTELDNPILENIQSETDHLKLLLSRYKLLYSSLSYLDSYRKIYLDAFHKENAKTTDDLKPLCEVLLTEQIYTVTNLFPEEEVKSKSATSILNTLSYFKSKSKKPVYKDLTPEQIKQKVDMLEELNYIQRELATYSTELYKLTAACSLTLGIKREPTENENKISQAKKSSENKVDADTSNTWGGFLWKPIAENLEDFITFIREEVQDNLKRDENRITEDLIYTTWQKVPEGEQTSYLNAYFDDWLAEKEFHRSSIYEKLLASFKISSKNAIGDISSKIVKVGSKKAIKNDNKEEDVNPTAQELVERMIKYVSKTVNLGQEHVLTRAICDLFLRFLEAGELNDKKHGIVDGVNQFMTEELTKRQITLCNFNIVKMLHELLSSDCPADCFLSATKLTSLLLKNGNREVQTALIQRMRKKDIEGKFFNKLKDSFNETIKYINRSRYTYTSDIEEFKGGIDDTILKKIELISILPMLTQLTEGHYVDAQSLLLNQQQYNNTSHNIIEAAYLTLFSLVPSIEVFTRITRVHSEILLLLLDFLSECVQGPCIENQNELIRLNIFATCRIMLISPELQYCYNKQGNNLLSDPKCKPRNPTLNNIKAKTMVLLSAVCEGQLSKELIDDLSSKIEPAVFKTAQHEVLRAIVEETRTKSKMRGTASKKQHSFISDFLKKFSVFARDDSFNAFDSDKNDYIRALAHSSSQLVGLSAKLGIFKSDFSKTAEEIKALATAELDLVHQRVLGIEVMWQQSIHEVHFVVPIKCRYLSEATKQQFLDYEVSVDNNSCDSRKKQLMDKKDVLIDEMDVFYHLASTIPFFRFMLRHSLHYKTVLFAISCLLNFHIMISSLDLNVLVVSTNTSISGTVAFTIKIILGLIIIIMHIVLFLFYLVAGFDLKRRALNRVFEVGKGLVEKNKTQHPVKIVEFDQLIIPIFFAIFYIAGAIVHFYNFQERHSAPNLRRVYVYIGVVIFAPIFITKLRSVFRYPTNLLSFCYCLAVDTITMPTVMSSAFFVCVSYCGLCYHYAFFSLLLTDFLSISEDAYTTVRSVTVSTYALSNLVVIFLIVIIIYAIYGYAYFGNSTFVDGNGDSCNSLLSCIGMSLYNGILNGNLVSAMQSADMVHANDSFAGRFFYDILFAVTVGQLLMNMVTGIITDAFGSMRGNTETRRGIYNSESFISGLSEGDLELVEGIYPRDLDAQQHNIWHYIFYAAWLEGKDKCNDNGLESFVRNCLKNKDQSWMPHKACFQLQAQLLLAEKKQQESIIEKQQDSSSEIQALKDLILQNLKVSSEDKGGKSDK